MTARYLGPCRRRPLRLPADRRRPRLRTGPTAPGWRSTSASTSSTSPSARAWARASGRCRRTPDVLNYCWREYGNRVGAWRCLELFEQLGLPAGIARQHRALRPLPRAGRGLCGARRRAHRPRPHQRRAPGRAGRGRRARAARALPRPHRAPTAARRRRAGCRPGSRRAACTPDLLAEAGYRYTLNWCHDDQPVRMRTRGGEPLWSVPYPQELNDIPMIVARQMDAKDFAAHGRRQLRRDARAVAPRSRW